MDMFLDAALLSRVQFAITIIFHFIFVPLSIGLGLVLAIFETRYYRSRKPEDLATANLWLKIFTTTFVVGVATGITMEFSFGTNWANYSRFVGDIFGSPLAAEALFAFFLESSFLGVLLFARRKVSPGFYCVAAWLVWAGSLLSALWILIANSWMQTPAGAVLNADGTEAIITNFFAAAFNPSTFVRYTHTVNSLLIMGAFVAMAIAAWYLIKNRHTEFAMKTLRVSSVIACITVVLMLFFAHSSAVEVAEEQPTKFAMMEGAYESEPMDLYLFGWVDEEGQELWAPLSIPGGTSFLASWDFGTVYPGMLELAETEKYADFDPFDAPVNLVFQSYHIMVAMFGIIAIIMVLTLIFTYTKGRDGARIKNMRWLQWLLVFGPIFPFIAIQTGWLTAEVGRQPWVVYPSVTGPEGVELLTDNAISMSVTPTELTITITLFLLIYLFLLIAWGRIVVSFIQKGPVVDDADATLSDTLAAERGHFGADDDDAAELIAAEQDVPDEKGGESR